MGARFERLWSQLAAFFLAQPPARRVAIGVVGLVSMAAVLGLAWWAQRPLYRPLFTNLAERRGPQEREGALPARGRRPGGAGAGGAPVRAAARAREPRPARRGRGGL